VYVTGLVKSFGVAPLACTVEPTTTLAPFVVNVATNPVTFVPYGTITVMVFAFSSMVPVAGEIVKEYAVMAFSELGATVTVTVYAAVVPSAADTMYVTGLVKSFGVTPLVCTVAPLITRAPFVLNAAISEVISVPYGAATAMVFALSLIAPVTGRVVKENAVMAFAALDATVTVAVYDAVVPSAAVTVYGTGFVKSFGVTPLVCTVAPTITLAPFVLNAAISAVTFVPYGTVTAMVFAVPLIVPAAGGLAKAKAVMAFTWED
jgi:hypothetical protein